jgi:nitrogen fixation/metabolism regulation signal transduction histidine kinase
VGQVSGLKELVDAFQEYARMPTINPQPTAVGRVLRELGSLYGGIRDGLQVRVDLPEEEIVAMVDPVLLRQALVNLLDNAVWAITDNGTITVAARNESRDLIIEVEDSGVGLPTEDTETLFEPFFSTKGRGSGMGLALVHRIVSDHGGVLDLQSIETGGTRVRIVIEGAVVGAAS